MCIRDSADRAWFRKEGREGAAVHRQHGDTTCDREPRVQLSHEDIALRFSYIRELVSEGKMTIHYVSIEDNLADIGTKHLTKQSLQQLLHKFKSF